MFLICCTVNGVVEELTADQAMCLTSNQIYKIMKYKLELLFTMLLVAREEQTTTKTTYRTLYIECIVWTEKKKSSEITYHMHKFQIPLKKAVLLWTAFYSWLPSARVRWSCVQTVTALLLKTLLPLFSEESQLTCRLPEKHPLVLLLHQPVKENKSSFD